LGVLPGHAPLITELGIGRGSAITIPVARNPRISLSFADLPRFLSGSRSRSSQEKTAERRPKEDRSAARQGCAGSCRAAAWPRTIPISIGDRANIALQRALIRHPGLQPKAAQCSLVSGLLKAGPCRFFRIGASCHFAPPPGIQSNRSIAKRWKPITMYKHHLVPPIAARAKFFS